MYVIIGGYLKKHEKGANIPETWNDKSKFLAIYVQWKYDKLSPSEKNDYKIKLGSELEIKYENASYIHEDSHVTLLKYFFEFGGQATSLPKYCKDRSFR